MSPLFRTAVQTVLFWGVFLFALPRLIIEVDAGRFQSDACLAIGLGVFVVSSGLGLWSGWTMAVKGGGTPLPLDPTTRLVVGGPYSRVRNPMAIAGLSQGAGVGLWLGSPLVLAYVVCGGIVWHVLVRPWEERQLAARFGVEYERYRSRVKCWCPRWRALGEGEGVE